MSTKKTINKKKVNPFNEGVTYELFLNAVPDNMKISEYLKDICSKEEINWIEQELTHFKKIKDGSKL